MMSFNKRNVAELHCKEFEDIRKTKVTAEEIRIKDVIKDVLETYSLNPCTDVYQETSLEVYGNHFCEDDQMLRHQEENLLSDHDITDYDCTDDETDKVPRKIDEDDGVTHAYKERAVAFWNGFSMQTKSKKKKRRTFTSVQSKFKKLKSLYQLYRWEKSVIKGGTKYEKYKEINKRVLMKFKEADANHSTVHDTHLRRWGIEAAREVNMPLFKASRRWCFTFKKNYKIRFLKITKFITRAQIANVGEISEMARDFVKEVKEAMLSVGAKNTYNCDQRDKELYSDRSLQFQGVKSVPRVVQSINSTPQSYTIQPTTNAEGEFLGPLLLVLQEPGGCFGPIVKRTMFQPPNLKVVATTSGKCTKAVLKDWYKTLIRPNITQKSMLLLDAYGGFNDAAENENGEEPQNTEENAPIIIKRIPKHTTGIIQPLDVMCCREYKELARIEGQRFDIVKK